MKLLDALSGKNQGPPPVWLMRQAGRYLPAYRALREKHSLKTLFLTPELAAEVTLLPLQLGVDAAILFSDISLVALGLGLEIDFCEGPVIREQITSKSQLPFLPENFSPIVEAVHLVKPALRVPLIGFCGAPFTVATYLSQAKTWLYTDPASFRGFLSHLTDLSIALLQQQVAAGVDVVQIFDSWASELTSEQFQEFCLPYLTRIIHSLSVPVIFFMRNGAFYSSSLHRLPARALSCDWQQPLVSWRQAFPHTPLQGNLDPDLLLAPADTVRTKTRELLLSMQNDPAFILNLGHGVKPQTPVENVQTFIDAAHYDFACLS